VHVLGADEYVTEEWVPVRTCPVTRLCHHRKPR